MGSLHRPFGTLRDQMLITFIPAPYIAFTQGRTVLPTTSPRKCIAEALLYHHIIFYDLPYYDRFMNKLCHECRRASVDVDTNSSNLCLSSSATECRWVRWCECGPEVALGCQHVVNVVYSVSSRPLFALNISSRHSVFVFLEWYYQER